MERNKYITDKQVVRRAKAAVRLAIEKKKVTGAPIVSYDCKSNKIYKINEDGSKTVLGDGIGRGFFSEQGRSNKEA